MILVELVELIFKLKNLEEHNHMLRYVKKAKETYYFTENNFLQKSVQYPSPRGAIVLDLN